MKTPVLMARLVAQGSVSVFSVFCMSSLFCNFLSLRWARADSPAWKEMDGTFFLV